MSNVVSQFNCIDNLICEVQKIISSDTFILLLGGTKEAYELHDILLEKNIEVIHSFAGRTKKRRVENLKQRIGGFGGVEGLLEFVTTNRVNIIIDATHPFAERITKNAYAVCSKKQLPLFHYSRPAWESTPDDQWIKQPNFIHAAQWLTKTDKILNVFLAIGHQHVNEFKIADQHQYYVRMIENSKNKIELSNPNIILDRPKSNPEEEIKLFNELQIDLVVSRNSGGSGAFAKLIAARRLSLPVLMINQP